MKRGDYRGMMVVPAEEMLFLPAIEQRLEWMDFIEAQQYAYLGRKAELDRWHAEKMVVLHEEFEL